MIEKIEISNFQSHKFSVLDLPEGLSVIAGRTHSGKSSIVRGIKWALQNRPVGDQFRRDGIQGDTKTSVSLLFDDESYLVRERSNKGNIYLTSLSEEPLEAVKTDVPDEVKSVSKLKNENLMSQGDGYFLIGKTSGKAAAEYNRIVGLEIISEKLSKGKSIISDITNTIKVIREQIKEKDEQLSDPIFTGAIERLERINKLANMRTDLLEEKGHLSELRNLISAVSIERDMIEECSKIIKSEKKFKAIKDRLIDIAAMKQRVSAIEDIYLRYNLCVRDKLFYDEVLKNSKDFYEIKNKWESISNLRSKLLSIEALVRDIKKAESTKERALQFVAEGEKIKVDIEERLNYCSKCGSDRKYWRKEFAK